MELKIELQHELDGNGEEKVYVTVPVPKASTKGEPATVEVCIDDLPGDVYMEALRQGLKHFLGAGMSKITGDKTEESRKAAFEIAKANAEKLYSGKIRISAGGRTKIAGAVKVEAMRIARLLVKDAIKRAGKVKISRIPARTITVAATKLLDTEQGAVILKQAQANIAEREKEAQEGINIDVSGIKEDPDLVKKAAIAASKRQKPGKEARA